VTARVAAAAAAATPATGHGERRAAIAALERATIDASGVTEEESVDGWLFRFSPGKAKRARSVQALAPGLRSLDDKLADLIGRYRRARLPALLRITPLSAPDGLDAVLQTRGWRRFDESLVMARPLVPVDAVSSGATPAPRLVGCDGAAYAQWIGAQRGSSDAEIAGHVARLSASPVPYAALQSVDAEGRIVAGGQLAVDRHGHAGLYDVFVDRAHRRAGHGRHLCAALVARAAAAGATVAYLQVDAANAAAIALYRDLGFAEAYRYHYREAPDEPGAS
jgi:ribosomal protein S18 acetylase RimI-like enzyme